jgi:hypothetical protein
MTARVTHSYLCSVLGRYQYSNIVTHGVDVIKRLAPINIIINHVHKVTFDHVFEIWHSIHARFTPVYKGCGRRSKSSSLDALHGKVCYTFDIIPNPELYIQGPYFVAFPNLREALTNHVPIRTQARSCTILPNFVGCVLFPVLFIVSIECNGTAFDFWCIMGKITCRFW